MTLTLDRHLVSVPVDTTVERYDSRPVRPEHERFACYRAHIYIYTVYDIFLSLNYTNHTLSRSSINLMWPNDSVLCNPRGTLQTERQTIRNQPEGHLLLAKTHTTDQWLKWSCEAGGSPDEARLEQTPYPFHTQLIWRYLGIK